MNRPHAFELTVAANASDHLIGPAHAPVIVVEYGGLECPSCKQAAPVVRLMLDRFAGRVRFAFRHFPLEEVHPHAMHAAEAAECAGAQGKFWPMHDLLFENQPQLKLPQLRGYADRLQLDMKRYDSEMNDHVYLQRIREHMESGRDSGVRSTPGFFVNGAIQDVSFGLNALLVAVDEAAKRQGPAPSDR